jgi:hypothetical protein
MWLANARCSSLRVCLSLAALLLAGCGDVVKSHYTTYGEAKKEQLFARGWLPEIIPTSATAITTANNLDLNRSEGDFAFPPAATEAFLARLVPYSGRGSFSRAFERRIRERKAEGYSLHEYQADQNIWVFLVNKPKGRAYYSLSSVANGKLDQGSGKTLSPAKRNRI